MRKKDPQFKEFGERFREALEKKGLTKQTDIAKRLTIGNGHLSDLLKGYRFPSKLLLSVIEERLGISLKWLTKKEGGMYIEKTITEDVSSLVKDMSEDRQKVIYNYVKREKDVEDILKDKTAQASKKISRIRRRAVE